MKIIVALFLLSLFATCFASDANRDFLNAQRGNSATANFSSYPLRDNRNSSMLGLKVFVANASQGLYAAVSYNFNGTGGIPIVNLHTSNNLRQWNFSSTIASNYSKPSVFVNPNDGTFVLLAQSANISFTIWTFPTWTAFSANNASANVTPPTTCLWRSPQISKFNSTSNTTYLGFFTKDCQAEARVQAFTINTDLSNFTPQLSGGTPETPLNNAVLNFAKFQNVRAVTDHDSTQYKDNPYGLWTLSSDTTHDPCNETIFTLEITDNQIANAIFPVPNVSLPNGQAVQSPNEGRWTYINTTNGQEILVISYTIRCLNNVSLGNNADSLYFFRVLADPNPVASTTSASTTSASSTSLTSTGVSSSTSANGGGSSSTSANTPGSSSTPNDVTSVVANVALIAVASLFAFLI